MVDLAPPRRKSALPSTTVLWKWTLIQTLNLLISSEFGSVWYICVWHSRTLSSLRRTSLIRRTITLRPRLETQKVLTSPTKRCVLFYNDQKLPTNKPHYYISTMILVCGSVRERRLSLPVSKKLVPIWEMSTVFSGRYWILYCKHVDSTLSNGKIHCIFINFCVSQIWPFHLPCSFVIEYVWTDRRWHPSTSLVFRRELGNSSKEHWFLWWFPLAPSYISPNIGCSGDHWPEY